MPASDRLRIFVPHASDTYTDHLAHGDGLVAFEVTSRLAARGHDVHVMSPYVNVRGTIPPMLTIEPGARPASSGVRTRIAYVRHMRATFARLHRARPFDLIHQLNPVFTGISLALAGTRVPVVLGAYVAAWPKDLDAHLMGAVNSPLASVLRKPIALAQQRLASALIVTTPAARLNLAEPNRDPGKIYTIPHGIDPARYDRPPEASTPEAPTILFLGGTERRKGIYVLLEAFKTVRRSLPEARLLIAGGGGREGEVAQFVATMDERDSIDFAGVVQRAEIPALMRRVSVFAAPSYGEPFGMALLEAMASERPVVVTDAGGPGFIVDPGGGFKVPAGDTEALGAALLAVLRSPELAAEMGRFNRARVESTFAWDRVIDRIEDVYARTRRAR